MTSSFDSTHPELPFPPSLTPPSRYLTSPTPPLFGMPPDKASISSSSSPVPGQRSLHEFMTPRKLLATKEIANSSSPLLQHSETPRSATRYTPRQPKRSLTRSVTVNIFSSPQGGQSEHRSSSKHFRSPSSEILAQLEPEEGENDDHGDRFKGLLIEAKETFTDKAPDFVINDQGIETRSVQIANNKVAELVFEYWDKRRGKGFWTIDLGNQQKYIVKHFKKGRHYRAWFGLEAGYDEDPIAWQKSSSPKNDPKDSSMTEARAGTGDASTVAREDLDASEDNATPVRALRRRSHLQIMPYTTEKIDHKRALQGKPKRRIDFDYDVFQPPRSAAWQISAGPASAKKRRTSNKSDSRTVTPSSTQQEVTQETVKKQTRLNTRLATTLSDLPEVVYLEDAPSVEALFDEVTQAWHSKIPGDVEVKLAVNFPWLDENDTNSTLSVRHDRPRSFDRLLEMITKAPCWEEGSNAECVVKVHVMIE